MATTIQTFEGSVGIGTDNPSKTLHVQGGLLVTNKTEIQGNLTVSGDTVIINSNDITINDRIFGIGSGHVNHNEDTGVLLEHKDNGTYANVALVYHADEKRLSLGYTQNTLTDNHVLNFQDPTHLLKIDLRGNTTVQNTFSVVHDNMGIGTETPGTKLDVHGTANVGVLTTTSLSITSNLETPNLHVDTNTSRVGIGTNTPLFNIDVHGKANVGALTVTSISGDGSQLTGLSSTLQEKTDTGNTTSNTLQFTNDITGLVTSSNIVVGGNVTATSFIGDGSALTGVGAAFTTSGSNLIRTSGNVGVGTDTPSRKLDIHGNLNLTKDFYTSNLISTEYSTVSAGVWSQVGADIDGEAANDQSGESVALSSDGTRLAVGGWLNDGTGGNAGHVRVFEESGGTWTQVGTDIDGEAAGDHFGWSVALSSDGSRLAAGGYYNDANGSNAGHVRVYEESGGAWTQLGDDIDGEASGDRFGWSVALSSDGTRLAVGAIYNDGGGSNSGHVRVFDLVGSTWTQVGSDIDGEAANDEFGRSVALSSDGTRLAVGGRGNDGGGTDSGHVRVFEESGGTWTQVGDDIDGEAAGDHFGWDVALSSNGTRLAAGGYLNDANGSNAGHVRVFEESGGTWTQVGGDIDGETASDLFGISVALSSDGTRVAAGAAANDTTGTDAGHVRVFEESGGTWTQVGANIDGEAASDYFGWSVALSSDGTRLAAGGYQNDGGGFNAGHVRVFDSPRYTKQTIKDVIFEIGGSNVYVDTTSGNVGVGTNTPYAKLHVQGSSGIVSSASKRYFNHSTNLTADTGSLSGMSIYANDHIVSGKRIISKSGTITASDRRIKQNIKDVKDDTALNILRLLKPKRYSYRDVVFQGDQPVWGFIAQEVENVLPYAVQTNTSYIPNIYDMATRGGDNLLTFTNFDTSNLESNSFTIQVYDENENAYTLTLKKIIDSKIIQVEEKIIDDELFVYGQRVENFKQLQKDAIFTIATSALQEVDKRLQIEKEKNDGLEERIIRLEKMFG
jgi:hypothetical protein